jgi:hypothetical protein
MNEAIETIKYQGYTIKIYQDEDYDNDFLKEDDGVFLVHYHRDFWVTKDEIITKEDCINYVQGEKIEQLKQYYFFGVKAYIHSGVSLALIESGKIYPDERWDVSRCGFVLVSKKEAPTRKQAYKLANGLIAEYNSILNGEIYGYVIKDNKRNNLESCWGFVGDIDYCITEAKSIVESLRKNALIKQAGKLKSYIMNKVSLEYRQASPIQQ